MKIEEALKLATWSSEVMTDTTKAGVDLVLQNFHFPSGLKVQVVWESTMAWSYTQSSQNWDSDSFAPDVESRKVNNSITNQGCRVRTCSHREKRSTFYKFPQEFDSEIITNKEASLLFWDSLY
jgi:hypothetical protein